MVKQEICVVRTGIGIKFLLSRFELPAAVYQAGSLTNASGQTYFCDEHYTALFNTCLRDALTPYSCDALNTNFFM